MYKKAEVTYCVKYVYFPENCTILGVIQRIGRVIDTNMFSHVVRIVGNGERANSLVCEFVFSML
jgi:hypothetical protein